MDEIILRLQVQIQKHLNQGTVVLRTPGPRVQTRCKSRSFFPCSQVVWTKYIKSKVDGLLNISGECLHLNFLVQRSQKISFKIAGVESKAKNLILYSTSLAPSLPYS